MSRKTDGGYWSREERKSHINVLELKPAKFPIMTFTMPHKSGISIHLPLDNIVAMSCLLKMGGGTKSKVMVSVSKEIWDYFLSHRIAITAEYLPGVINLESISKSEEYKQMEIVHKDIQNDFSSQGNTRHRRICLKNISIASSIHDFETRPFSRNQDDFQINMSRTFTQSSGSSKKSRKKESPTDSGEFSKASGLDHLMESLHAEGMSKRAITFITSSRRISSVKHYESA